MGMNARGPTNGIRMSSAWGAINATIVHSLRLPPCPALQTHGKNMKYF